MTYAFRVFYEIDSDIPGDSGKRSKIKYIEAETEQEAFDYAAEEFAEDEDYTGFEIVK